MEIWIILSSIFLFLITFLFINFVINLFFFKDISIYHKSFSFKDSGPLISVFLPARNEEENIEACVRSLMAQEYLNIEILVLDDNSTDDTHKIVSGLMQEDKRIKLFAGKPLQDGWMGKNFALYQLEKHAQGEYFFFTDADTVHQPTSISSSLGCLLSNRLDALSAYPAQVMKNFWERLLISFIQFGLHVIFPIIAMEKIKKSDLSVALGALMFYKAEAYRAVGGHTQIKGKCLEDIRMSKLLRRFGFRFRIFEGKEILSCRMYKKMDDAERAFRRFVLATFDKRYGISVLFSGMIFVLFLLPFILLPVYLAFFREFPMITDLFSINLAHIVLLLFMRIYIAIKYRWGILDIAVYPTAILSLFVMSVRLIADNKKKMEIHWKGRKYCLKED